MAQEHGHTADVTTRDGRIDLRETAVPVDAPARSTWTLADEELAQVVGGTEGPGGPTDGTSAR